LATGNLVISDMTSLPICDICREDWPVYQWIFVHFRGVYDWISVFKYSISIA